eukprot:CAMPEP_0194326124 /NCGR_PEP_ID=MMETSP0171-20130528/34764_1 /TAXON_ID=218684 /ORGANISM="Corethron pennatum, Strain L29A3" /LENGTH=49 /DNA_ID= /DNA_START= /DNA_END= /DNA_ORIENTATION=
MTLEGAQLVAAACESARLGATTLNCAEDVTLLCGIVIAASTSLAFRNLL